MRLFSPRTLLTAGGAAVGVTAYQVIAKRRAGAGAEPPRPHSLTVFRPVDEVAERLPEPLARIADRVTIDLRAAPGGRGTEIHVHPRNGAVPAGEIRSALREARSLLEVGDVLKPGGPTTEPTLFNKPLRAATRHGREGGLL
jgi:hypothetical protein